MTKRFNFKIDGIYIQTFRAGDHPGSWGNRALGFVDVAARVNGVKERVTLGFYRSSGTNSGKIQGQWYPIIGIKMHKGVFTEFSDLQNGVLSKITPSAGKGWFAKSLFFRESDATGTDKGIRGYSYTNLADDLKLIAEQLQKKFEAGEYIDYGSISDQLFNDTLMLEMCRQGSQRTQRELHDFYIKSIFEELLPAK